MRYFMFDAIVDIELGKSVSGIKCITRSEMFMEQHFPSYPVYPGALLIESCAQLAGYLIAKTWKEKNVMLFPTLSIVEKAKFHNLARPGDQILIRAIIERMTEDLAFVSVHASVTGKTIARMNVIFSLLKVSCKDASHERAFWEKMYGGVEDKEIFHAKREGFI